MASRKLPTGPPPSAGVLAKYVHAYAREAGLSEGRVRGWISYMVMAGALERAAESGQPRFTVKGGIADGDTSDDQSHDHRPESIGDHQLSNAS